MYKRKILSLEHVYASFDEICIGNSMIIVVIYFGLNTMSDSKLLYVIVIWDNFEISQVVYLWQISRTNHAIICLYYNPQKVCNFHM